MPHWSELDSTTLDWSRLDRLRQGFLTGAGQHGPYWRDNLDLQAYAETFGERIGWKWDAVIAELDWRQWKPSPAKLRILDWGCGSGVAAQRVVRWLTPESVEQIDLWDHSPLAAGFATETLTHEFPGLNARPRSEAPTGDYDIVLLSHIISEIGGPEEQMLAKLLERAGCIIWVEPGTSADARRLVEWRARLQPTFEVVAPCPHQGPCGMFQAERDRDWCHHFASPPKGVQGHGSWVKFAQRAGIDLRSLPYSFLVMAQAADLTPTAGWSRLIGRARFFKPYARFQICAVDGIHDLELPKRLDKQLFKSLDEDRPLFYHWDHRAGKITGGKAVAPAGVEL